MSDGRQRYEFPLTEPILASVRLGGGSITVVAEETSTALVTIAPYDNSEASRTAAEQTTVTCTDDRLVVDTPQTASGGWVFRRGGRVRVDLRLPLDSRVRTQTGSADLHTEGRLAEVQVNTGSGDTYVGQTTGELSVESGSGDVRVDEVGGALRVKTGSGDVSATSARGPVVVRVASGDVEIEEAAGPVKVSSASGDVRLGAVDGPDVSVNSASGDVEVGVPAGTRVWLDLHTMSGSTRSDLEMTGPPTDGGTPQVSLQVRTMSGDIAIHRAGVR
ncbi:MAG TPA: DUF4097 family beta strand repeat-containing protein [Micromonosporaceae bacterium]